MHEEVTIVNSVETESPAQARRTRKPAALIIRDTAAAYGITVDELTGHNRTRKFVRARCAAMRAIAAEWEWLSYPAIGRLIGGRDHTTCMYHLVKEGDRHNKKHCTCDQGEKRRSPKKGGAQ